MKTSARPIPERSAYLKSLRRHDRAERWQQAGHIFDADGVARMESA